MHVAVFLFSNLPELFWVYIPMEGFYAIFLDYFSGDFADFYDYKRGTSFQVQIK